MVKRRFTIDAKKTPDIPGMMLVTVEALKELGGSATIRELAEKVIDIEGVTEEEQVLTQPGHKNQTRVNYSLAWARTHLKHGGALVNSAHGVWALTKKGWAIMAMQETREIYDQFRKGLSEKRKRVKQDAAKVSKADIVKQQDDDPEQGEDWKSSLLAVLGEMSPDAFERLSQRLLRESGFIKVDVRGKSGDGGIDGVGVLRVNLISFQIYFQCKRWKGSVGSKEIREFRGALQGGADKGLFITTGNFTGQASDEATRTGAIAIDLIDGNRLCDLLKQHNLGVDTKMIERTQIRSDWFKDI